MSSSAFANWVSCHPRAISDEHRGVKPPVICFLLLFRYGKGLRAAQVQHLTRSGSSGLSGLESLNLCIVSGRGKVHGWRKVGSRCGRRRVGREIGGRRCGRTQLERNAQTRWGNGVGHQKSGRLQYPGLASLVGFLRKGALIEVKF